MLQANKMQGVNRDAYSGDVVDLTSNNVGKNIPFNPLIPDPEMFHNRPSTASGTRNLQDSSFSLSGM